MKYVTLTLLLFLNSCGSSKKTDLMRSFSENKKIAVTTCPDNGTCKIEVLKNKTLKIQKDGIGATYPTIVTGENTVVKYTFTKNNPNNYADGNESETIHFELSKTNFDNLVDTELNKVKLLYGKNCFSRDIAGYYPVNKGSFTTSKDGKTLDIEIDIPKVGKRQLIRKISIDLE